VRNQTFQLSFNASLKVDFQGSRVTSDGSLILVRELEEISAAREVGGMKSVGRIGRESGCPGLWDSPER
jgi:hypothetical protein